jgi:hypothetical protein
MTTFDTLLIYFGVVVLVLFLLYGTRSHIITLIAGYIVFCVFYFDLGPFSFEWTASSMLPHFKDAGVIYIISYAIGVLFYRIFPAKKQDPVTTAPGQENH